MDPIAAIETFVVNYPVRGHFKFFEATAGRPVGRPAVVVKITSSNGHVGWGQSVPSPRWSYETIESVQTTIRQYLAPELIGKDIDDAAGIWSAQNRAIANSFSTGQPICKAGIDLALFDLIGQRDQLTAAQRWNRTGVTQITLSWTLNPRSIAELESSLQAAFERGYRHFNLKIAPDPDFDLDLCSRIKRHTPGCVLWVDANGGYDVATALQVAPALADLGVAFFEQPVAANRLDGFRRLKAQAALPIIMDEGLVSAVDLEEFHCLGLLDGAAIKIARVGGLTEARKQVEFLQQNGLIFLGSGLTDPDLSLAASLLLYGAYDLQYPAALNGPQYLSGSILSQALVCNGDQLSVPIGFGLGFEVDEAALAGLQIA